jgi:hypothetical protein
VVERTMTEEEVDQVLKRDCDYCESIVAKSHRQYFGERHGRRSGTVPVYAVYFSSDTVALVQCRMGLNKRSTSPITSCS